MRLLWQDDKGRYYDSEEDNMPGMRLQDFGKGEAKHCQEGFGCVINMVSEQIQQAIMQAQAFQQQLQVVATQKEALSLQLIETGKALEELTKPSKEDVYKIVGPVLIKVNRAEAKKDIESKRDLITLRMKTLEKSEARLKEKLEELRAKLTKPGE
jgi:prefoldin beta subunit